MTVHHRLALPAVMAASLAVLQPGIDPVFLTLVSKAHGLQSSHHGWIVGATQAGMALGAVLAWRVNALRARRYHILFALTGFVAALATVLLGALAPLLVARAVYGCAMGILYTQAMARAARERPSGSYGAVFVLQLLVATLVALGLPAMAEAASPAAALALLCLVPLTLLAIARMRPDAMETVARDHADLSREDPADTAAPFEAWLTAIAGLLFICTTMMVWSFTGAMATAAGIAQDTIGTAVALGSICGALTALAVMRERIVMPPLASGLLATLALLCPVPGALSGDAGLYIATIAVFNIGCTAIIVRTSGLASAASSAPLFRRFVSCTHALGMIGGPLIGGIATTIAGSQGLPVAAASSALAGCLLLAVRALRLAGNSAAQHDRDATSLSMAGI